MVKKVFKCIGFAILVIFAIVVTFTIIYNALTQKNTHAEAYYHSDTNIITIYTHGIPIDQLNTVKIIIER